MNKIIWKSTFLPICLCLLLWCRPLEGQEIASQTDSLLLVSFQKELIDQGWPVLWDTTQRMVRWRGVSLDVLTGKVAKISVRGDWFEPPFEVDSLSSAVGLLCGLDSLKELNFNLLGIEKVSDEIVNLVNLESLGLGYNRLKALPGGINDMSSLKSLVLNDNDLQVLPPIDGLINLIALDLSSNRALGELPESVYTLSKLENLSVGYTSINSLSDSIAALQNLTALYMKATHIEALPESLGELSSLEILDVGSCRLSELSNSLGNLAMLKRLDVSDNIIFELPDSISRLSELVSINFANNQLDSFPRSIVELPKLKLVYGHSNSMEGSVPEELFERAGLRLFLEDNELSGELLIKKDKIPERLYVRNNRFTFKDVIKHYKDFGGDNNIEFFPQKKIGRLRTVYPESGDSVRLWVEGYTPAVSCVFNWYKLESGSGGGVVHCFDQEEFLIGSFNSEDDGGIFYCEVTHPDFPGKELESHRIKVIGNDVAPVLTAENVKMRIGSEGLLSISAVDDFTSQDSLVVDWSLETAHLKLYQDSVFSSKFQRKVRLKESDWVGTDTIVVTVKDEGGNASEALCIVTVFPRNNIAPVVNVPDVYMNIFQDMSLPCVPGDPECTAFYPFESGTYLEYFVSDDMTEAENFSYRILEADESTGVVNGNSNILVNIGMSQNGVVLNALVMSYQDTTVTVTLEVKDDEGSVSECAIRLIGLGVFPNEHPVISEIPSQAIVKGMEAFSPLDMSFYVSDDYVGEKQFVWESSLNSSLLIELQDNVAYVQPLYNDSCYSESVYFTVSEKTNYKRTSQVEVEFSISNGFVIKGEVKDERSVPLSGVKFLGFPQEVCSDDQGRYEVHVFPSWEGVVVPFLDGYAFSPDTLSYNGERDSVFIQDYIGVMESSMCFIEGFVVDDQGEPLDGVILNGFIESDIVSDADGSYFAAVPKGWSGCVVPTLEDYVFFPDTVCYSGLGEELIFQDFVGTRRHYMYRVSGVIENENGPLGGVVLEGFPGDTVRTDLWGYYECLVPEGWYGVVVPIDSEYVFWPSFRAFFSVQDDYSGQSFYPSLERTKAGIIDNSIIGRNSFDQIQQGLGIYPNPAQGEVTFEVKGRFQEGGRIEVFNDMGNMVANLPLMPEQFYYKFSRGELGAKLPAGVYYARLLSGDSSIELEKFILLK